MEQNRKIVQGERAKFEQERAEAAKADAARAAKEKADAEALRLDRLRNPAKYLEQDYGPDWHKALTEIHEKGSPPAGMVASELGELEKRITSRLDEVTKGFEEKLAAQQKEQTERALKYGDEAAVQYVQANPDAYPLIHSWEALNSVPAAIRQHFDETFEADGVGEVWTPQQAAQDLEKKFNALVDKAIAIRGAAKDKPKTAPTLPPAAPVPAKTAPETSQPGVWKPVADEREAQERAWRAAVKARNPSTPSPTA